MICPDEFGPVAAKSSPGPSGADDAHRPHFSPDDARHGPVGAFGALQHRTGEVSRETADPRDTRPWLRFLDGVEAFAPEGEVSLIVDALPRHRARATMPGNRGHPRFHFVAVPQAAAWLNRIEGFRKIPGQRSPAGRDFHGTDTLAAALQAGGVARMSHPTPFLGGRPPTTKRQFKHAYAYRI